MLANSLLLWGSGSIYKNIFSLTLNEISQFSTENHLQPHHPLGVNV